MIAYAYESFCETRFPLPSEADVTALEQRIGVTLPDDYRRYLLEYNGGFFDDALIPQHGEDRPLTELETMNGIGAADECAELGLRQDILLFDDNEPPQILPIGRTLGNYLILLVTHPDENGSILLRTFTESFWLADGIEDFFALLAPA